MQSRGMKDKSYRKRSTNYIVNDTIKYLPFPIASVTTILCIVVVLSTISAFYTGARRKQPAHNVPTSLLAVTHVTAANERPNDKHTQPSIRNLHDLTSPELYPKAGPNRHIVDPPPDNLPITLVTCNTTVGFLHVSSSVSSQGAD